MRCLGQQVVGGEQFVDPQVDADNVLDEGQQSDRRRECRDPRKLGQAQFHGEQSQSQQQPAKRGVGFDRSRGNFGQGPQQGVEVQPPSRQGEGAHEDQDHSQPERQLLEPSSAR